MFTKFNRIKIQIRYLCCCQIFLLKLAPSHYTEIFPTAQFNINTLVVVVCMCISNVKSVLNRLVQLTDNIPRHEPQNINIQQQLAVVRAKFKQVGSFCSDILNSHWRSVSSVQ